ncbi:MAG: SOS response-associated peptidase family protein [Paracoccus sp. (in: a-proteobacteria)]|nr:SOS response-associated peptidase family protein [Paracoccus sp. (in: a-proteobacteria)]
MTRRSTPQSKMDERAFPCRILIAARGTGICEDVHGWLRDRLGYSNFAVHSGRSIGRDAIAFYFRHPGAATEFLRAFPALELADGTMRAGYTSPYLPVGRAEEDGDLCNLYNNTAAQDATRALFAGHAFRDLAGNLRPGRVYPDQQAAIIRHGDDALEMVKARWGMPSPRGVLRTERDPGVTNVRNLGSPHWRRWLGPAHRCLVPVTEFAEPLGAGRGNQWFAAAKPGTPMFFAGIETRGWASVRKVKDGETVDDLFAFLTCPPNREVVAVHPKAMPVILTDPAEWEAWMTAPFEIAAKLQRPLPDGALRMVDEPPKPEV